MRKTLFGGLIISIEGLIFSIGGLTFILVRGLIFQIKNIYIQIILLLFKIILPFRTKKKKGKYLSNKHFNYMIKMLSPPGATTNT